MDTASVYRLISLIPDRMPRSLSGSAFNGASSQQAELLSRFLSWLGPLNPINKDEQHLLGARTAPPKPLMEGEQLMEGEGELMEGEVNEPSEDDSAPIGLPGAGTRIAA
jgi:hypothetical protein